MCVREVSAGEIFFLLFLVLNSNLLQHKRFRGAHFFHILFYFPSFWLLFYTSEKMFSFYNSSIAAPEKQMHRNYEINKNETYKKEKK